MTRGELFEAAVAAYRVATASRRRVTREERNLLRASVAPYVATLDEAEARVAAATAESAHNDRVWREARAECATLEHRAEAAEQERDEARGHDAAIEVMLTGQQEDTRRERHRADSAEAERDALRAKLDALVEAASVYVFDYYSDEVVSDARYKRLADERAALRTALAAARKETT